MNSDERQNAWSALRMIADVIGERFGPIASLESEDASLLRGPEYHHFAKGIVEALLRIPVPQPSGAVATLERGDGKGGWIIPVDVLSEIQKDAGEWADETYLETVEAIALAVERRLSALTAGKPEQGQSGWPHPTAGGGDAE